MLFAWVLSLAGALCSGEQIPSSSRYLIDSVINTPPSYNPRLILGSDIDAENWSLYKHVVLLGPCGTIAELHLESWSL